MRRATRNQYSAEEKIQVVIEGLRGRLRASEKLEIIRLVERSHLPVKRTLPTPGISKPTFYRWLPGISTLVKSAWRTVVQDRAGRGSIFQIRFESRSLSGEVNQKRSVQITDPNTSVPSSKPGQTNVAYGCCLFNLASHNRTRISSASTERYVTNGWTNISFNQSHMPRRQRHNGCGVTIPSDRTWQSPVSHLIKSWRWSRKLYF